MDLDRLRGPFDAQQGDRTFRASKSRNTVIFEQRFRPDFAQYGEALEVASANSRGLVIGFI